MYKPRNIIGYNSCDKKKAANKSTVTITPEDIAKIIENAYREGIRIGLRMPDGYTDIDANYEVSNAKKAAQDVLDYMGGK